VKEIVIISGKGGTGKTSLTAAFATLAGNAVLADCDVDAADLFLVMDPTIQKRSEFRCGNEAVIRQADCIGCGACLARCRFDAVKRTSAAGVGSGQASCSDCVVCSRSCSGKIQDMIEQMGGNGQDYSPHTFIIESTSCEGCGVCVHFCPVKAIDFPERIAGEWFISRTSHGDMVHARLNPGGENSGKLVSKVKEEARRIAKDNGADILLVDGPPGVGCPVIAAVSGAALVLIVTEPTLSGIHDMMRVIELARHFSIPAAVCVNKWDLNPEMTERIERESAQAGAMITGRIRYDRVFTKAQINGKSVIDEQSGGASDDIRKIWSKMCN